MRIASWRGTPQEAAAFLAPLNRRPEHYVVFLETEEGAVARSLEDLTPPLREGFLAAWEGDSLVGMLGAEWDLDLGQAWLYGPFVASGDWEAAADPLFTALAMRLPRAVQQVDLAGDTRHVHLAPFAERQGFSFYKKALLMNVSRARFKGMPSPEVVPLRTELADSLATLHNRAFPGTYFRGDQLTGLDPAEYPILVGEKDGRVTGYAMFEPDPQSGSAFFHFLAVSEEARGSGLGRKLLESVLARAFADPAVREVSLTVDVENTGAAAWYERMGFDTERTVIAYRKRR